MELQKDSIKIKVGKLNKNGKRDAIRISTNNNQYFNERLFIIKAGHIPEGLGVWPAFWLNGSNMTGDVKWACNGEIDIIEGVDSIDDKTSYNTSTLHTGTVDGNSCVQTGVQNISNNGNCGPDGTKNINREQDVDVVDKKNVLIMVVELNPKTPKVLGTDLI